MKKFWDSNFESSNGSMGAISSNSISTISSASSTNLKLSQFQQAPSITQKRRTNSIISSSSSNVPVVPILPINNNNNSNSNTNTNFTSEKSTVANTQNAMQLAALTKTITELKLSVDEMEKERDFYFNKLRDIEILTQKIIEPTINSSIFFKQITEILYTTEEGFEIPQETFENNNNNNDNNTPINNYKNLGEDIVMSGSVA